MSRYLADLMLGSTSERPLRPVHCLGTELRSADLLRARALAFAGGAVAAGVQPGDHVLLLVSEASDFLPAFWGVVLAGATAVPLAGPRDASSEELGRVRRVMQQVRGIVVVDRGVQLPEVPTVDVGTWLAAPPP